MDPQNPQIPFNPSQPHPIPDDEFTIKDVIRELNLWKKLVLDHWIIFLIGGMLSGTAGFLYAYFDTPLYTANTRFMLKNEGVGSLFGGQMSTLTGLLGGGQMGTPLERTAEVISSDRIIGKALLRKINIHDSIDLVINHFIRLSGLSKKWENDSVLNRFSFQATSDDILKLTVLERRVFKLVKAMMIPENGAGVVRKTFDKKSGILTLSCMHQDEDFAIRFSEAIYSELNSFFIEQMTYTSVNNAEVMKKKLDSIQNELNAVRRSFAAQSDQSLGLLLQQDKVDLKTMAVKEQLLSVMYAEALRNYESFEFINKAAIPSLTLIDFPYSPLKPVLKSPLLYGLIFLFCFFVFSFIFLRVLLYFRGLHE